MFCRYLLNSPEVSLGRRVLDLGCGCGATAIAAKLSGAAHVVANDIDPSETILERVLNMLHSLDTVHSTIKWPEIFVVVVAVIATRMNCELNGLEPVPCVTENMMGQEPENWDLVLLGDMFYDESLADSLHHWLGTCIKLHGTQILIGDPGRAQFESHNIKNQLHEQAQFELPDSAREENYGLTSSSVWLYKPD